LIEVRRVDFANELDMVLDIYHEYVGSTSVNLDFQENESEFANLSQKYDIPGAGIFLAWLEGEVVGCAAYRKVNDSTCELKRVYVRPSARGHRLGSVLLERVLKDAKASNYKKMSLDVLLEFETALALYQSYGFKPDKPVTFNPIPGTAFLSLELRANA